MQKHASKESGKTRECLIKGVTKKRIDSKEQKGSKLFLLDSNLYNLKYDFAPYYCTELRCMRKYIVYKAYMCRIIFDF
jgi:hypothetical protein